MKTQLLILAVLVFSLPLFGQNFYSGIWDADDYHYDFNPDTNLLQPPSNETNTIEIDLNGDGIKDFRFSALFYNGYQWSGESRLTIKALNQNQLAYSGIDSCWGNYIPPAPPILVFSTYPSQEMDYNELIDNSLNWTDSIVCLSYDEYSATYPTNVGFHCSLDSQFESDTGYIAVRLNVENETFYGWIKISNVNHSSCVIHEFACGDILTSIDNSALIPKISIHPNPTSGRFTVENFTSSIKSIKVYNAIQPLKEFQFTNSHQTLIDLSQFSNGIYFLRIETSEGKVKVEKVVLSKN